MHAKHSATKGANAGKAGRVYSQEMPFAKVTTGTVSEAIRYSVAACSLGSVLVAACTKGLCAVFLGDEPASLADELRKRFPRANPIRDDAALKQTVAEVIALIETPQPQAPQAALPLDIRGTAFQLRVWEALRAIPAGSTRSYADIARGIGMPKAVRAVAGACAANTLAVVIPCHRVVRSDGGLSGYRWGVERKRTLLKRESAFMR